jgi:AAHS family benzoate transporter-like MFS transporter
MSTTTPVPGGATAGRSPSSSPIIPGRRRSGLAVTVLCFVAIVFDGYDLVIFGSTVPSMLADESWSIDPAQVGVIGSLALVGMLIGTLVVGALTDILGRRVIMMLSIAWFSVFMLATALAPTPELFGVFRFITGIGLGGIVPTCVAMTVEFAPRSRRQLTNATMYSGYAVGGVLAAVLALMALPAVDFRWLYAFGALPLVVLLPVVYRLMPESIAFLAAKGREDEARATAARYGVVYEDVVTPTDVQAAERSGWLGALRILFSGPWIVATMLFALASFCGLLLVYGMNAWLPQIMQQAGYELGSSLVFLLSLNVGAIVGAISASYVADRIGVQKVVTACFAIALASILLLSVDLPYALLLVIVAFAGLGSVGTQILINGFVATHYPQTSSATALGWSLGVGRLGAIAGPLIGGYVAALGTGYEINFYVFAAVALVGGIVIAAVPAARAAVRS